MKEHEEMNIYHAFYYLDKYLYRDQTRTWLYDNKNDLTNKTYVIIYYFAAKNLRWKSQEMPRI